MADRRDLAFLGSAAVVCLLGLVLVVVGVWGLVDPRPFRVGVVPLGAGVVVGPLLLGLGAWELARRLRRGPQPPGRHSR